MQEMYKNLQQTLKIDEILFYFQVILPNHYRDYIVRMSSVSGIPWIPGIVREF